MPLETLQNYVTKCFSDVPNNNLLPDDFSAFSSTVFNTKEFSKMYYVKPTKDFSHVSLSFSNVMYSKLSQFT